MASGSMEDEIRAALNRHSAEQTSGTPDYILAEYLIDCLNAFNDAATARAKWRDEDAGLHATGGWSSPLPEIKVERGPVTFVADDPKAAWAALDEFLRKVGHNPDHVVSVNVERGVMQIETSHTYVAKGGQA